MSTPDIGTASVGALVLGSSGGYGVSVSHRGTMRLLHFTEAEPDLDIEVRSASNSQSIDVARVMPCEERVMPCE
jgi:hypothetical protein